MAVIGKVANEDLHTAARMPVAACMIKSKAHMHAVICTNDSIDVREAVGDRTNRDCFDSCTTLSTRRHFDLDKTDIQKHSNKSERLQY